ncbi:MAG: phage terminase large subunit family protein [Hoeflea sp.]|uniref:terminase gpA endonuclease subunit n=1 Tax=Hoeflea sp. TaxID=1940281 RepID=UPI001D8D42CC|nr:terminase gpA endonuclease subunit [Hoeflea sp.]MBU4531241.1 phage terminase large subunit family protein [Alphaproteobacteria bacterium]MBU4545696.1 phage terminase large subunit family protein [Alphaproteobacteria bacterium]MBU4550665.1 phage terminase large subunit family protein [Alphaproteobacteria bacterium]MBV1724518.1 phage terminase large subunit family protein [Hoeflea sp.]MBV1760538.1 phage terminase large subunit family protein [Hoeflea sp.]
MNSHVRHEAINLAQSIVSEFAPDPRVPTDEWFERHVTLENGQPWRLWKPQRQIAEASDDPHVRKIVIKSSARIGKTQTLTGLLLRGVAKGLNIGLVQARRDDAIDFSNSVFSPAAARCRPVAATMRRSSKSRGRVAKLTGNESRDTALVKTFSNGSSARFLSAESPGDARRISLDWILFDESSAYGTALGAEGDPIALFSKRTGASYRPLHVIASTPLGENCHVSSEFDLSDKRLFFVACPHCGHEQTLEFERLTIGGRYVCEMDKANLRDLQANSPDWQVEYACLENGCLIEQKHKRQMIEAGTFKPTAVAAVPGTIGFSISALYSRFSSADWRTIAAEWMAARGSPEKEATFTNTVLGRSFSTSIDKDLTTTLLQEFSFAAVDEQGFLHPEILQLTAGVDVGGDRSEITILARRPRQADEVVEWVIVDHVRVYGDPTTPELFDRIEEQVNKKYRSALGGELEVELAAIDSGNWSTHVYEACHAPGRRHWRAIKGVSGATRPLWQLSKSNARWKDQSGKLFLVGVDQGKTIIMQLFNAKSEHRRIRIAQHLCGDSAYLEQLLAEERIIEPGGRNRKAKIVWRRKPGLRAESLDCLNYSMAAAHAAGVPDWDKRREELSKNSDDLESAFAELARQANKLGGLD